MIEQLVDKFGIYCQHIQHAIPEIKNSKDQTTLRGKFEKLVNAKVLLASGFFSDILSAAKTFSSTTQKSDINIIAIVENIEMTKRNYSKSSRATLKQYLPIYQHSVPSSQRLREMRMENQSIREKLYLKNHGAELIESILSCYIKRYCDVYSEGNDEGSVSDGDDILFHVCCFLNSAVWPMKMGLNYHYN